MTRGPQTLPVIFTSAVVKREAVARSFPGGVDEFVRRLEPARANKDLYVLARMSMLDAGLVFEELHAAGLVAGEDFGLVGMREGVVVACNGIRATVEELEPFVVNWSVHLDTGYVAQPEDSSFDWGPLEPEEPQGPVEPAAAQDPSAGQKETKTEPRPPRRVVFGSGPVHWLYDDDDDEDD